ncbi:phosphonoacetaldehyde reductase [Streptomyces sp. NPDC048258]|uniref:phosphonoacetaldehyde reductase n=1 Tax=Streptomyces sp. NPDC048258 TaxID=3365527 RepID=UPI00371D153F
MTGPTVATGPTGPRATTVLAERGAFGRLPELLDGRRVLVVASKGTLHRTDAESWLPAAAEVFSEFHPNPTVGQAVEAAGFRHAWGADLVLGMGGGSALDVAKAAALLPKDYEDALSVIAEGPVRDRRAELVLVPTTAGTGSEVTRFATLYQGHRKVSLDTPQAKADLAIVDPALTDSCPAGLTWTCVFDSLAHAVESLWSVRSTPESRGHAVAALRLLVPILRHGDELPGRAERDALSRAATLAGRAIDITRTTAAHALSYPLTARLGIPHGLACALNLTWLIPLVAGAREAGRITDPRGPEQPAAALETLATLFGVAADEAGTALEHVLARRVGAGTGLWPEPAPDAPSVDELVREGLCSDRMAGMPVRLDPDEVRAGLARSLGRHGLGGPGPEGRPGPGVHPSGSRTAAEVSHA